MKKQKGITLIALVVTIVILVILAGVAINLTLGENGIFTKAQYAKEQYEMVAVREKLNLAMLEIQTEEINNGEVTLDTMLTRLQEKLLGIIIEKDGETLKGTLDGYDFVISGNFEVTIEGYNEETENEDLQPEQPEVETYTVTFSGKNVSVTGANTVQENESYTATLTVADGYKIATAEVKMGNTILTQDTHYNYEDGTITIASVTGNVEINVTAYETIESQKTSATTAETYYTTEKTLIDSNGNIVKVPAGFKVAQDSGINVTEGIVIEDNDIISGIGNNRGNQYVWIPVGEDIKKSDGTTVDITLGRYKFADGTTTYTDSEGNALVKGTPILVQDIEDYTNQSSQIQIAGSEDRLFYEDIEQRSGLASEGIDGENATALSILDFKNSVAQKHGYYIARYEASYGEDGKANSKISNSAGKVAPTEEGTLWNKITQIASTTASRELYNALASDLANSYAWDTAIVYIQEFSNDTDYSYQKSMNTDNIPSNTGENDDEVCKINDIASNVREWTTEYCMYASESSAVPCSSRGGCYLYTGNYVSYRGKDMSTGAWNNVGFRIILY